MRPTEVEWTLVPSAGSNPRNAGLQGVKRRAPWSRILWLCTGIGGFRLQQPTGGGGLLSDNVEWRTERTGSLRLPSRVTLNQHSGTPESLGKKFVAQASQREVPIGVGRY
jgi:hypothetical protein